jgi:rSAM/selenodomain-associated transferase 1
MTDTTSIPSFGIFIMMKYPKVGRVKARLAQSIGDESATNLYRMFIRDTLTTVQDLDIPFYIAVHPPESQKQFAKWIGPSYQIFQQQGIDIGERLQSGFTTMFERGYKQVIALASDSPDLPIEILREAVSALQSHKAVIGPASDGGYYLIGLSHDHSIPGAFEDISWSTETVFRETLSKIKSVTQRVHILPEWADIDTKSDLQKFYEKHRLQNSCDSHTMNYLCSRPELLQDG